MGENIVINEFLARRFLVTHLDKGTRGVSANADLMLGHAELTKPVLVQVKACVAAPSPNWVFLGALTEAKLAGTLAVYNSKDGFKADVLALVAVAEPNVYRTFVLPIAVAEEIVLRKYRAWHATPKRTGEQRRVVPTMYIDVTGKDRMAKSSDCTRTSLPMTCNGSRSDAGPCLTTARSTHDRKVRTAFGGRNAAVTRLYRSRIQGAWNSFMSSQALGALKHATQQGLHNGDPARTHCSAGRVLPSSG
jgi:hypothetical protein